MNYILMISRVFLILVNTGIQMSRLSTVSLIKGKSDKLGFKYRRIWARVSLKLLGVKLVELEGDLPQNGPFLVVGNHRSLIDPIVQLAFLDSYIIAKSEVGKLPLVGKGAQMTGIIFVDRSSLKSRNEARNATENCLTKGQNVLVYAEGTTTTGQTAGKFKPGTFRVACTHGIPVIPVAIEYRDPKDYWYEKGLFAQMVRQIGAKNTYVKLRIGPPTLCSDQIQLMNDTRNWIDQNLISMQTGWSRIF